MGRLDENYFKMPDVMQSNSVEDILDNDESVLLRQKPKKKAYIFNSIIGVLPLAIFWLAIDMTFIVMVIVVGAPDFLWLVLVPFFAFHLMPVWFAVAKIVRAVRGWKNIEYVFTEKRIIVRSGMIGINFANIYYSDIHGVNLRVGFFDRFFKVGDIYISASVQSQVLYDLENPYFILSRIQKIVIDLKTDVYFPNDLRPETNSGFNTKYKPKG